MNGDSGEIILYQNQVYILVDNQASPARQRYTVMHELGHYLLGHLGETPLSRSEQDCKPSEEQAADKFAIDMLAPACVLWGLQLHTPEEIAKVCNISIQAAGYRAKRMKLLYQRNKFLSHPLERKVYAQFHEFINQYYSE
ncbi:MAG: ImmA/IrrE family metallo-endopeptidase, partial [Oscillospiraceae bacterium]|nr:ImmA/IrrE family metallo-endopeptidase [Oscillospiraceae bacterium]